MKKQISRHNHRVLNPKTQQVDPPVRNRRTPPCPLNGACISSKSVVYKATVEEIDNNNTNNDNNNNSKRETYTGLTKNTFKERYDGHNTTFNNRDKSGKTTLAAHIWKLKDKGANYNLSWSIIEKGSSFNPSTRRCSLCLKEKFHIIFNPAGASLNQRTELFSVCRHRQDMLLEKI